MTQQICNLQPAIIPRLFLPMLLLLLLQARWGCCHPQCLDYKPPFEPQKPLGFCKEYSKFGCCDVEKDDEISTRFYTIMENFDHSGYVTCGKYVRSILCQVRHFILLKMIRVLDYVTQLSFSWQSDDKHFL